ncbi:MAG: methyltransferase domain-containing protein [bacterium]|nr:methyltransferase domain-containing protein [bacterium]
MEENQYTKDFYNSQRKRSRISASHILPLVFEILKPKSILDIGCGTGEWLKASKDLGVNKVFGIDGYYVDHAMLSITEEEFMEYDLKQPVELNKIFDLAISMEVAEHLPEDVSDVFIGSLTNHSNCVLFSAAIPDQGGTYHINEQWQDYWVAKFEKRGYLPIDFLRNRIWESKEIDWWYKQNMILFVENETIKQNAVLNTLYQSNNKVSYNSIHPELKFILNKINTPIGRFSNEPIYTFKKFWNYIFG